MAGRRLCQWFFLHNEKSTPSLHRHNRYASISFVVLTVFSVLREVWVEKILFERDEIRPRKAGELWKFPAWFENPGVYLSFMHGAAWMMPPFVIANIKNSLSFAAGTRKCAEKREFVLSQSLGVDEDVCPFRKPWTQTFENADPLLVWEVFFFLSVTEKILACYTPRLEQRVVPLLLLLVPNPSLSFFVYFISPRREIFKPETRVKLSTVE